MVIFLTDAPECGIISKKELMILQTVLSVSAMRQSDFETIAHRCPSRELMRRAGEGIYNSHTWSGPVAIVCGSGNNAGDGYVLALSLFEKQIPCR